MLARRVYRLLLLAYPADFRAAVGSDMEDTFLDRYRAVRSNSGLLRAVWFWCRTLWDTAASAIPEHKEQRRMKSRERRLMRRTHSTRGLAVIGNFWQDLGYSVRKLRKSPGFAAIAITIMGLGIGANTAIFSIVSAVLFRPLPYENPSNIVRVFTSDSDGRTPGAVSYLDFVDYRARTDLFSGLK
jgi:putative ABC transport system permease protein